MKNVILIIAFIISASIINAQNTGSYTEEFDRIFQNVDRADATTGILYERVAPFAGLMGFDIEAANPDTSDYYHFKQAYSELYRAAFLPASRSPQTYSQFTALVDGLTSTNTVYIGALHYRFNVLDSMVGKQKLSVGPDGIAIENPTITASLYMEKEVLVMAPLAEKIAGEYVVFRFNSQLFFDNTDNPISQLQVDFGDGLGLRTVYPDFQYVVQYASVGIKTIRFVVTFQNGTSRTAFSTIQYNETTTSQRSKYWNHVDKNQSIEAGSSFFVIR